MTVVFGAVVFLLAALAWVGQLLAVVAPRLAVRLGLTEPKSDVDPVFGLDVRAEAIWDALTLWILPVAAIQLVFAAPSWPIFGLVGGGMFLYFAGRGLAQRILMQGRGIRIGQPATRRVVYLFLALWGLVGVAMIGLASANLLGE